MSTPIDEGVGTKETSDEIHRLIGHEPEGVNLATSRLSTSVTSEEEAR